MTGSKINPGFLCRETKDDIQKMYDLKIAYINIVECVFLSWSK